MKAGSQINVISRSYLVFSSRNNGHMCVRTQSAQWRQFVFVPNALIRAARIYCVIVRGSGCRRRRTSRIRPVNECVYRRMNWLSGLPLLNLNLAHLRGALNHIAHCKYFCDHLCANKDVNRNYVTPTGPNIPQKLTMYCQTSDELLTFVLFGH